jgi:hypothetical protein
VLQRGTDDQSYIVIQKAQINSDEYRVFTCITFARWHGLHPAGMQTARITRYWCSKNQRTCLFLTKQTPTTKYGKIIFLNFILFFFFGEMTENK